MRNVRSVLVTTAFSILIPAVAFANHDANTATPQGVNARPTSFTLSAGQLQGWFVFAPTAGRSYCVEINKGASEFGAADSVMSVRRINNFTFEDVISNNNSDSEPNLFWGSRVCFVQQFAEWAYVVVAQTGASVGVITNYEIRIVDTTLFSPYFAVGGGYDAAPQIRNNTSASINVFFTAYNAAGTALPGCPTSAIIIPANGMTTFGVSSHCAITSAFGSAQIAHNGSPGAVSANITTFSGGSGLSFDAAFAPRQDYRH